jgi:nucleotide-binding universal stress UspA family protein
LVLRERAALPQDVRNLGVLVPLDGSDVAAAILEPLLPLAKTLDWQLRLLWVTDVDSAPPEPPSTPVADAGAGTRGQMLRYLEQCAATLRAEGVAAEVGVEAGACAECIVRCAEPADVGLIAIGTHGRHGLGRLVLGSVAEQVIAHASKPVLAIRPKAA